MTRPQIILLSSNILGYFEVSFTCHTKCYFDQTYTDLAER